MSSKKFILGAAAGVIAGAAAGILLTPKSGAETRKIIKGKVKDYSKQGKILVEKGAKLTKEIVAEETIEAKKVIKEVADKVSDKMTPKE